MKKTYRSKIALMLATIVMTGMIINPVYAAEETEAAADGEYAAEETFEGDQAYEDYGTEEYTDEAAYGDAGAIIPAVSTPDGMMVASSFPDNLVPLLFHKTTSAYQGTTVEAAQFDNGNVLLLYITDSAGNEGVFKEYNEATGELTDFLMLAGAGESFIVVLPLNPEVSAPSGFTEVNLDWNGLALSAYVNNTAEVSAESDTSPSDYLLLYAVSSSGRQGWYLYDQVEATFQRYVDMGGTSSASSEGGVFDFQGIKNGNSDAIVRIIIFGAMVLLIIILIILAIILGVKLKEYSGYDYIDEEEYNAIAGTSANGNVPQTMQQTVNRRVVNQETETSQSMDSHQAGSNSVNARPAKSEPVEDRPARQNHTVEAKQERVQERVQERPQNSGRRNLLETGDIADLDDILNDPNLTSNLPQPKQIDREIARQKRNAKESAANAEVQNDNFEDMQVTVDRFAAGMPAMVDTDMIADDLGNDEAEESYTGELPGENFDEYNQPDPYNHGFSQDSDDLYEDDYYLTRGERKERKALEKQRRREEKEAEKDAKYLERERRKAEKSRRYGYDEATPMDWSAFGDAMREESPSADNRRPVGNNEDRMPAYMKKNGQDSRRNTGENEQVKESTPAPQISEEERANAAADAVIAAARGGASRENREYREYRQNSRNQYEEFRHQDELEAKAKVEQEQNAAYQEQKHAHQQQSVARLQQNVAQPQQQPMTKPSFSEDLDEDFEFEFLNIRHPQ